MGKLKSNPLVISLLLITFIPILAYLPLIPFLGFYSEDIFYSYTGHFYGLAGIIDTFKMDRPFTGYLVALSYFFLKDNVTLWHIFMFLLKMSSGYMLFFFLMKFWPNTLKHRISIITSVTILFLIYPGFLQQPLPIGYHIYGPTPWIFWLGSLIFSFFAIQNRNKFKLTVFIIIAVILQILTFLNIEFYIGLEVLRFFLLALFLKADIFKIKRINFSHLKKVFICWSPYLIGLVLFFCWRILIFKSTYNVSDINWVSRTFYSNPLWIAKIPLEIIYSWIQTVIFPFFIPVLIRIPRIPITATLISLLIGIFLVPLMYSYYKIMEKSPSNKNLTSSLDEKIFGKKIFLIGVLSIFGAIVPIVLVARYVRLFNVMDRYTTTSTLAVGLLAIGILLFKTTAKIRYLVLSLLIAISVVTHLMNGFLFKTNWDKQKEIWWQLYWRAPKIENNAILVFDFPKLQEKSFSNEIINKIQWQRIFWIDEQIWNPANLFFNYNNPPKYHFAATFLPDKEVTDKIKNKVVEPYRYFHTNITLTRDFNNTVIISAPNDRSCLWVMDKTREELPENANDLLRIYSSYSDADKLVQQDTPITPPFSIFGNQLTHNWCYYFQKASLYRQMKNWSKLDQLTQEVLEKNLKPKDVNEWLPFIEGFIIAKKYSEAEKLIEIVLHNNGTSDTYTNNVCTMINRLQANEIEVNCPLAN